MAYTHNYIPYNCDIILIQKVHALTYPFPNKSSHSFHQFQAPNPWTFLVHFTQTRDYFYSPKIEQVGCPRATHFSYIGSSWWNRIPWLFPASYIPTYNLMLNFQHKQPNQFLDYHGQSKKSPKIPTIRSQVLGPIKRPFKVSNQPNHH